MNSESRTPKKQRGKLALLSVVLLLLAPLSWAWTIDSPFWRKTGLSAWLLLALALGCAWTAARVDRRLWVRAILGLQVAALALFVVAEVFVNRLPEPRQAMLARAPEFSLVDPVGETITLSGELAKGPVLLVFFRGHW